MFNLKKIGDKHSSKLIATFVTLSIIGLLLLSGPAGAFSVGITEFFDNAPKVGNFITSVFSVNMAGNEGIDVVKIQLLKDDVSVCDFDVNGSMITACNGLTISKLGSSNAIYDNYSYGYGYGALGSSELDYSITLDTAGYDSGVYGFKLNVITSNRGVIDSTEQEITISSQGDATSISVNNITNSSSLISIPAGSINLVFEGSGAGNLTVEEYANLSLGANFMTPFGKYLVIDLEGNSSALSNDTEIRVSYTHEQVAAAKLEESSLRLAYYDSSIGSWVVYNNPNGGVNVVDNYIWAKTNHFSIWGVFGNLATSSSSKDKDECLTFYICGQWGSCIDGYQTRSCEKMNPSCASYESPLDIQTCLSSDKIEDSVTVLESKKSALMKITGAVVGTFGYVGAITLGLIIIVLFLIFLVLLLRRFIR